MDNCRTYWGSHGCCLPRGHDGPHLCRCTFEDDDPSTGRMRPHADDDPAGGNVGRPPYYGEATNFYGEDAPS